MNNCLVETYKNPDRPPFWTIWLGWMVYDVLMILEGLVHLVTLNFIVPTWTMRFACWCVKMECQYMIKRKNKQTENHWTRVKAEHTSTVKHGVENRKHTEQFTGGRNL